MAEKNIRKKKESVSFWQKGRFDITFFVLVLILLTIGLVMLFSSSYAYALAYHGNSFHFISRQAGFAVAGVAIMLFVSKINCRFYRKFALPLFVASVIVLGVLLILPPMINGVDYKRWMVIGPLSFQPSEIAKFSVILLFSHLICKFRDKMDTLKMTISLGALLLLVCGLVVLEPHLSAAILIGLIGAVLMIVGGMPGKHILGAGILAGLGVAVVVLTGTVSYASSRFEHWINPWADASGDGYQTIQSLLAIGSGGLMGRGLGQSRQKYLWVPEPHNDFIFSIVCEEVGLIGALIVIILFALLVWRGFTIAMHSEDAYSSFMALGLTFQVGIQAALNILVVTNTVPNTGISLPFFSYGGTALMILLAEMGIILSISRSTNLEKV